MKNIITSLLLVFTISTFAQTGIGTTTPNANAQLEVASTAKGFLPPRVALTSTISASPLAAHVAGMVVYNTATVNDVTPGLYVNNGTIWEKQAGGGASSINDLSDGKTSVGDNIYLGYLAGASDNATAQNNIGIGRGALNTVSGGMRNTAIGAFSQVSLSTSNNTSLGAYALQVNTSGSSNIAIGVYAGNYDSSWANNSSPNNSIFIGSDTRSSTATDTNQIVIGDSTVGNGSNTITLGNSSITSAHVQVAWTVTSDARDKNKFVPLDRGLEFINKLKPISFEFRKKRDTEETDGIKRFGFKAQDIETLENGDFVIVDNKDTAHLKIKETYIIPILVKGMQEQQKEIDVLKKELSDLKNVLKNKGIIN